MGGRRGTTFLCFLHLALGTPAKQYLQVVDSSAEFLELSSDLADAGSLDDVSGSQDAEEGQVNMLVSASGALSGAGSLSPSSGANATETREAEIQDDHSDSHDEAAPKLHRKRAAHLARMAEAPLPKPHPQDFCRGDQLPGKCPFEEDDGSAAPQGEPQDPCADAQGCTGYHRCSLRVTGFRQCQYKRHSRTQCHTGTACVPACSGQRLGSDGEDCSQQGVTNCEGNFVVRQGMGIQCTLKLEGNPSGADVCEDRHICGVVS
ncbi:unnamed protein product [Effrenium voratum]|nr:unnamed protein product [Effrenium voratum]|mmetsp:Transcript_15391/g.36269  ORF Transcript_15391/g.36269 Transcript_15391/m.36269 type:complete len:262 (+) Transcript_15391:59-844(+)|eukprot:CAMPEP_0181418348 /NCGR_PEP_ID=MMETSP1110-20121109/11510_1 /TAXON_ID=174948 /ORGANISM="Symbiodinium sp., Strain CCMP421" /LENGTH=261 /DNA_ID=CAMNT_0023541327 /DNA_START=45 /DNA_END=830 /DNA_ORIENTATION=+